MSSRAARVVWWVVAVLLLFASGWSFNLATYNWFVADFHDKYSQAYASRGNIFSIVALGLFAATVWVVVVLLRSRKKRQLGVLAHGAPEIARRAMPTAWGVGGTRHPRP
jgi:TRAP-type C4-dicarboxylate transport system permease small subunit